MDCEHDWEIEDQITENVVILKCSECNKKAQFSLDIIDED